MNETDQTHQPWSDRIVAWVAVLLMVVGAVGLMLLMAYGVYRAIWGW